MKRRQEEKWGMIRWLTELMDLEINSVEQCRQIQTSEGKLEDIIVGGREEGRKELEQQQPLTTLQVEAENKGKQLRKQLPGRISSPK